MTNTNTATVSKVGRVYFVRYFRNGAEIGSQIIRRRRDVTRLLKVFGVVEVSA